MTDPVSPDPGGPHPADEERVVYRDEAQDRSDQASQDVSDYAGVDSAVDAARDDDPS